MVAGVSDLSEMPPYTHRISLADMCQWPLTHLVGNGLSPSAPTVSPSVAPWARRTAVAPCRGSWTTVSSVAAITLAATRLASLPRPIGPSASQFNQLLQLPTHKKAHLAGSLLLQNPERKGRTEVSGRTPIVRELLLARPSFTFAHSVDFGFNA